MKLVNRVLTGGEREKILGEIDEYPSIIANDDIVMDTELITTGGYSPLEGFLGQEDYENILENMRLADGTPWTIPIVFPIDGEKASELKEGEDIAILDSSHNAIAVLHLEQIFKYDKRRMAEKVFRTTDLEHPGVANLYSWGDFLLSGKVDLLNRPKHPFERYHLDPAQTRDAFKEMGWKTIVGYQTRNPIHRAHEYLHKCVLEIMDGLFIHPIVGRTKGGDIPAEVRMKSYELVLNKYYPRNRVLLAALSTAMRYAGPREAIFHAIVRRNFGCTHMIIGRDHAGVGDYYGPYDAQRIFSEFEEGELGIMPIFFENAFYCTMCDSMATEKTCPHLKSCRVSPSGTKVREILMENRALSDKIMRPEVAELLREYYTFLKVGETKSTG
jgi:sulfate adenylyltransferase